MSPLLQIHAKFSAWQGEAVLIELSRERFGRFLEDHWKLIPFFGDFLAENLMVAMHSIGMEVCECAGSGKRAA